MKNNPYWFFQKWVIKPPEEINDTSNAFAFANKVLELQSRIEKLEQENVELTNCLYELENRLQAQIDKIHPIIYNINENKNI